LEPTVTERVYNLFLFCEGPIITGLGAAAHEASGSDAEKLALLQARVEADLAHARRYPVPGRYEVVDSSGSCRAGALPYHGFLDLAARGDHLDVFEEVFVGLDAPPAPLTCITPVIGGRPADYLAVYLPPPVPPPGPGVARPQAGDAAAGPRHPASAGGRVLIVELAIGAGNEDILHQMRGMKAVREGGQCPQVFCAIRGFDTDPRELWEIPEVRAFCRRLVGMGFISYLDAGASLPPTDPALKELWGAAEVWLCGEGRLGKQVRVTASLLDELQEVLVEANARADAVLGPLT
jgi:hypothetical protein